MMQLYKTLVDTTITFRKTMYSYLFWYIIVYKMAKIDPFNSYRFLAQNSQLNAAHDTLVSYAPLHT